MQSAFKLIVFDLNKTLIKENSWYDLNLALGITPEEDEKMLNQYLSSELSYADWMKKLLDLYKQRGQDTSLQNISRILHNYKYMESAPDIILYLKEKGYKIALISGAMDILVEHVAKDLGLEPSMAVANNALIFSEGGAELIDIKTLDDDPKAKLDMLMRFCYNLKIDPTQCACIGDGDNDIELFKKTSHGITFKDSKISKIAWRTIDNLLDLKEIF